LQLEAVFGRSVGDIKKSFARAVEEAGLSGVTAYCLRSTMVMVGGTGIEPVTPTMST
jgi:hypothetical protein